MAAGYPALPRVEVAPARITGVQTVQVGGGTDGSTAHDVLQGILLRCRTAEKPALVVEALQDDDVRFAIDLIQAASCELRPLRVGIVTTHGAARPAQAAGTLELAFFHPRQVDALISWLQR